MSWSISKKTIRGKEKYKIWSTISDSYITPKWLTKEQVHKYIFWEYLQDFMQKYLETTMQFPDGWTEKETYERLKDEKARQSYWNLMRETLDNKNSFPEAFMKKIIELGIEMKISDGKYIIDTNN